MRPKVRELTCPCPTCSRSRIADIVGIAGVIGIVMFVIYAGYVFFSHR